MSPFLELRPSEVVVFNHKSVLGKSYGAVSFGFVPDTNTVSIALVIMFIIIGHIEPGFICL